MSQIEYKGGYKYQLTESYYAKTKITGVLAQSRYVTLERDGTLKLQGGYAWDGPSGPTVDTKSFMRGSLIHDGLYQLIRMGFPISRVDADEELHRACIDDGMNPIRAWWVHLAVRKFGAKAASVESAKPTLTAP